MCIGCSVHVLVCHLCVCVCVCVWVCVGVCECIVSQCIDKVNPKSRAASRDVVCVCVMTVV